jgi:hypothetical protein
VSEYDHEALIMGGRGALGAVVPWKKSIFLSLFIANWKTKDSSPNVSKQSLI